MSDAVEAKPELTPPTKPRRRRWKRILLVVLALLVLFACYAGWTVANHTWIRHQSESEYIHARAEVEQTEPDWNWERHNAARKQPPTGKNGAELIPQIKSRTNKEWGKELTNEKWKPLLDVPPNVRYSPDVIAEVRRDLDVSTEAVKLARTLKDFPQPGHREIHLKPDVLSTPLEDTQNTRHAADLLRWDVVIALEDGDFARAARNLRALLNASRSIGDEPFMISQLVRMAVRDMMIRHTERFLAHTADAPQLDELQTSLAADAEDPLLLYGVLGDRAVFDRLLENLDNGTVSLDNSSDSSNDPKARLGWWIYRAHLPADRAEFLRMMTVCVEAARLPVHEQSAAFAAIQLPSKDSKLALTRLLFPAVNKVSHSHWRTTAEARCAVVGMACERFRQKHNRWPNDLTELMPAFLSSVPLDPYDGEPLKYAKLDDGVAVHSVGTRPPSGFPNSLKPRAELPEGIEFGFRLWNPDQRRLPPLPDPLPPEGEKQP